jgi:hypothetical protein
MFLYIRKHPLFADLHTNIQFDAKNTCCNEYSLQSKYLSKIFSYWRIFASKFRLEATIRKTFSKFHIQVNIRLQIFTYQQIFATYCSNYLGKPFTSHMPQLIFGSF